MRLLINIAPAALKPGVKACSAHFTTAAFLSAFINILYLAPTIYMMQVYDRVVPTGGTLTLFWLTVIVGVAIATLAALDSVRSRLLMRASLRLDRKLAGEILDRLMARPKQSNEQASTAQVMRDFDQLRQTLSGPPMVALFDLPWTPLYVLVATLIHPLLGLMTLVGGALLIGLALLNERTTRKSIRSGHRASTTALAAHDSALSKAETIRALGMRRAMVARQLHARQDGLKAGAHAQTEAIRFTALTKFSRMFLQSIALGVGAWLAVKGEISVGAIIAASVLLSRALQPIEQVVGSWTGIAQARQAMTSIGQLFEATDNLVQRPMLLPAPEGYVELSNVIVRNPEGTALLLRGASLWINPGEVLGVIGASGAGKSTLARVIAGALPPDSGTIRIDEASYSDWEPEELARHVGYLPQDVGLLPGTIGENISRFAISRGENAAEIEHKIIAAATMAGVHDLILHLPHGYNACIGDGGIGLSGGQAQRIALARALYDDPKVIVLDEPASSLDAEGEQALMRAVAEAKQRGSTVILVAHRMSTLRHVDMLAVIAHGMIERQGPREEVMEGLRSAPEGANVVKMSGR